MSLAERIAAYEAATHAFEEQVAKLDRLKLDAKHPEGWSPRQVIHHLADSEAQSYARLRRLVAEPVGSVIQGYDEGAWATSPALGYETDPIETSLAVFSAVRAGTYNVLQHLTEADLERYGEHSERGQFTIDDWLRIYSKHPTEHGEQLAKALRGEL
ncbi:MAG: DinB family protein [bacterium]